MVNKMKRERVLELWKEFLKTKVYTEYDKQYDVWRKTEDYTVSKSYIDESEHLDDFLFDFVNFIEDKIFDEHCILNEEESKKFIEEMEKKEKEYDGDILITGKI